LSAPSVREQERRLHTGRAMLRSISILFVLTFGCSDKKMPEPSSQPDPGAQAPAAPAPADEAKQTFATVCSACHGTQGKGDGPAAATLEPKPRNYTDKAWQASVTDEQLTKVIREGGAAVGKSPLMPANPQLKDKPEVIAELVKIVRSFGQ
jgi:cytochrome c553